MGLPVSSGLQLLLATDASYAARYEQLVLDVENLSGIELKDEYPAEYCSWKNRKHWAKKNGVHWSPAMDEFRDFLLVNGQVPQDQWTLDRINPKGHYLPENLRWASKLTQSQNRTSAQLFGVDGEVLTMSDIAHRTGRSYDAVRMALVRHGDKHVRYLLDNAIVVPLEVMEHRWQFPEKYQDELESMYAKRKDERHSRLYFFCALTYIDFKSTFSAYSKATDPDEKAELENEIDTLRRLHNDAVRYYDQIMWEQCRPAFERGLRLNPHLATPKRRDCDYEGEECPNEPFI